jgi:hypothetical protein
MEEYYLRQLVDQLFNRVLSELVSGNDLPSSVDLPWEYGKPPEEYKTISLSITPDSGIKLSLEANVVSLINGVAKINLRKVANNL